MWKLITIIISKLQEMFIMNLDDVWTYYFHVMVELFEGINVKGKS